MSEKKERSLRTLTTDQLMFGRAPRPVRCGNDLVIGGGEVYPEINFTLPTMLLEESTWSEAVDHYRKIGEMITRTARRLKIPGLVVEFELLPPMTERPEWGAEVTGILSDALHQAFEADGLRSALRVTPVDLRDGIRPPVLRSGKALDAMRRTFELCADAGADIVAIESVGGKEVHDEAMMYVDIEGILFALEVLAPRDMGFLWDEIVSISARHRVVPGGDSACGFANTAMQLASQGMLPEVLAAMIRAASTVRSLVSIDHGAVGPFKDCAYEGPVLKAITGIPISMEGKSASCAHFSPVGNIAAAMCDLWSNESVQNVRLLSGYAPEAYLESLAYDCRLANAALKAGTERMYQRLLVESDQNLSPQALVLSPEATVRIAHAMVEQESPYHQTLAAARTAYALIQEAHRAGRLVLSVPELGWLRRIERALDGITEKEEDLLERMLETYGHRFLPESYGLAGA
jgi:methanol---5-hydroxybenzimidazolylcobamide Co-methyltransferase